MKHVFIIGSIIMGIFLMQVNYNNTKMPVEEDIPIKLEQPEFFFEDIPTKELVYDACEHYGIKHIDIVVAQSILETGMYRSEQCLKHNNLFGLYNSRKQVYFRFNHWTESVKAYRDLIQYRLRENEDYYKFLTRISYASDPDYIKKVKNIVVKYDLERICKQSKRN